MKDIKIENVSANPNDIKAMGKEAFVKQHPHLENPANVYDQFVKAATPETEQVEPKKGK